MAGSQIRLGLGLISIGREWGHRKQPVPSEQDALAFLRSALRAGIRLFDTAPSYGSSEERLGRFLSALDHSEAQELFIATKAGEHCGNDGSLYVDHSRDALIRSIDRSFARLGRIDLLQVHKATIPVLFDGGVRAALEYAKRRGAVRIGASVADRDSAMAVIGDRFFDALQFPFHAKNRSMEDVFAAAMEFGKTVIVNRPYGMGELLYEDGTDKHRTRVAAMHAVIERMSAGIILTGTRSTEHLLENIAAFEQARNSAAAAAH
jgi:aryl-alcohol dehydrogenase-like predicted oxidoreductase